MRSAWLSEAGDFTPWLARPDNLAVLGETIGVELELEAQEQSVMEKSPAPPNSPAEV
jgi:hypothetical protein